MGEEKRQERKQKLNEIINKYGYSDTFGEGTKKFILLKMEHLNHFDYFDEQRLQLVELIYFLKSCIGICDKIGSLYPELELKNPITLNGVIYSPQKENEMKGFPTKTQISNKSILLDFYFLANTLLYKCQEGLYEYLFKWDDKEYSINGTMINEEAKYIAPYTDYELNLIYLYEEHLKDKRGTLKNTIGEQACFLYNKLKGLNIFGEYITKDYSFLFDLMVISGKLMDNGESNKEKYDYIKNQIKSYENQLSKLNNKYKKEISKILKSEEEHGKNDR